MNQSDQREPTFTSAGRAVPAVVRAQYEAVVGAHYRKFLDALPTMVLVLNLQRQVVFANQPALAFLGYGDVDEVLGKRPGEALGCVNVQGAPSGCGTSPHCRNCATTRAILAALEGDASEGECMLLRREQMALAGLDLRVHATSLLVEDQPFVVFAISDISHKTRRQSMEHIFFHDILNLAWGINGVVNVLKSSAPDDIASDLKVLSTASLALVDEILAQRELLATESNELVPVYAPVNPKDILAQLQGLYARTPVARGQRIVLAPGCPGVVIHTDASLILRVLGNMLKNALEAGSPGSAVRLGYACDGDGLKFTVHNQGTMPDHTRENIFRRRFSTKGATRGLGTYSMLLLSERYLDGSVGFSSTAQDGTTFFLRLPRCMGTTEPALGS